MTIDLQIIEIYGYCFVKKIYIYIKIDNIDNIVMVMDVDQNWRAVAGILITFTLNMFSGGLKV